MKQFDLTTPEGRSGFEAAQAEDPDAMIVVADDEWTAFVIPTTHPTFLDLMRQSRGGKPLGHAEAGETVQ